MASCVKESFVRRRSSTLRPSAASAAARRWELGGATSMRNSKPHASTERRAVSNRGRIRPDSYRAIADVVIRTRFASSACVNPDRARASRITAPRGETMTPSIPSRDDRRGAAERNRMRWIVGAREGVTG